MPIARECRAANKAGSSPAMSVGVVDGGVEAVGGEPASSIVVVAAVAVAIYSGDPGVLMEILSSLACCDCWRF